MKILDLPGDDVATKDMIDWLADNYGNCLAESMLEDKSCQRD